MNIFKKITSILLSAIILLTTTGFNVTKFYCGSTLKSVHVLTEPDYCCSDPNAEKGSCSTETEYLKADYISTTPVIHQNINPDFVLALIHFSVQNILVPSTDRHSTDYLNYKPPLFLRDIPLLLQSILI